MEMILLITTNAPSPTSSRSILERRSLREASRSEAPSREGWASSSRCLSSTTTTAAFSGSKTRSQSANVFRVNVLWQHDNSVLWQQDQGANQRTFSGLTFSANQRTFSGLTFSGSTTTAFSGSKTRTRRTRLWQQRASPSEIER